MKFLKHVDTGVVVPWSKILAERTCMINCDGQGNPITAADAKKDMSELSLEEKVAMIEDTSEMAMLGARFDIAFAVTMSLEDMKKGFLKEMAKRNGEEVDEDDDDDDPSLEELEEMVGAMRKKADVAELAAEYDIELDSKKKLAEMKSDFLKAVTEEVDDDEE